MTQKFTTPCFIRKNTAELRKKLEELGYSDETIRGEKHEGTCLSLFRDGYWNHGDADMVVTDGSYGIDCGTNEDLFLALSALREDTDKGQWFCANEYNWSRRFFICKYDTIKEHINMVTDGDCGNYKDFHKATVEEIIEHFKD